MTTTLITVALIVIGGGVFYVAARRAFARNITESLQLVLFSVRFPRRKEVTQDSIQEIRVTEQLLSALASFKKPFVLEVAVPYVGEAIRFYLAVPGAISGAITRQMHALWHDVRVERAEEYNVMSYAGVNLAASVKQRRHFSKPIRTYEEIAADTFHSILGGLAQVNEIGEGGAIQCVARPAPRRIHEVRSKLSELKKGSAGDGGEEIIPTFGDITKAAVGKTKAELEKPKPVAIDESAIAAVERKLTKPLFEANIRLVASASTEPRALSILEGMAAGFSQFSAPNHNELVVTRQKDPRGLLRQFSFRSFESSSALVLTSEEIASVFHFPVSTTIIPRLDALSFKEAPPPADLPKTGITFGESRFRGEHYPIRMMPDDRRRHVYVVGQTGTGKSVFLNNLVSQDIQSGAGVCVVDPNGDLFDDVLRRVPKSRAEDVVIIDPSDLDRPIGLNMLEYDPQFPEQKTFIVNELLAIFNTLYDMKTAGGPMFEQYMRNALLLIMDDPEEHATLLEVPRVLADSAFRKRLLAKCRNIVAKDFWEKEAEKAGGEAALANMVPYITSKFNTFIANDYMRPIITQPKSTIHFRSILDRGNVLLVNLSKGRIGDLNASLLGMIVVGKLALAAFSRADVPMDRRRDFYLYIDEFHNFTTPTIATILSEARKYRLNLTVAHQFVGQLLPDIRNAVFGNVGSVVAFRVGADDAEFLAKQFEPVFDPQNLIGIDNLNAHVRMMIGGRVPPPFTMVVPFPPRIDNPTPSLAREYSRLTYGRPRAEVEMESYERLKRT